MTTGAVPGHLRLGLHALSELSGRLLKRGQRHPASLGEKAQVRIAAQRSLVADLTQEVTHAGMVLQIPRCQVRWQPLDLERPGGRARRERPLQNRPERGGIVLRLHPQPVVKIALWSEVLRGDEHAPAAPKRARERNGPVGRIAVERHLDPARPGGTTVTMPAAGPRVL